MAEVVLGQLELVHAGCGLRTGLLNRPAPFARTVVPAVMGYFTGMLGNVLPLGGVDGGMVAAFIGFGVPASLAAVAVLSCRAFAFWLATIPGVLSYLRQRRTVSSWDRARLAAGP